MINNPNPAILAAAESDDPVCGKEFNPSLCRVRHMAARLREERGRRYEYDPCCYCPKFLTQKADKPQENQEEPQTMPTAPKINCITPDCSNTVTAHGKTGRCHSCQAKVNAKLAHEARKNKKPAPRTGAKTLPDLPASIDGIGEYVPGADTIHAAIMPTPIPGFISYSPQETIYRRALRKFGDRSQIMKTAEEASELSAAIMRYISPIWNGKNHLTGLLEEIADVEIMCKQMRLIFGDSLVNESIKQKLARLERRLADD